MRLKHLLVTLPASAGCLIAAHPSHAQFDGFEDEAPAFVAEERQTYLGRFNLNQVPNAVLDISDGLLREVGATDLDAALDLSASIARQTNFGGLWNSFSVRGLSGPYNAATSLRVNGFEAGLGYGGPRDISNVERIEVLKGPKAAIFGRGEPGGAVNLVSKRPTFEREGDMRVSYGRFDDFRMDGDYTSPLSDTLAVRVVGFFEDSDSFRDGVERKAYGITPSITWKAGDDTRLTYELDYNRQDRPLDRGIVAIGGMLGDVPRETFLGESNDGDTQTQALSHQLELQQKLSDTWSVMLGANYRGTSLEGTSTEAELSADRQLLFQDGQTLSRQRVSRDFETEYFALRAEFAGEFQTGGITHRLLVGADYDRFENDRTAARFRPPSLITLPTPLQAFAIDVLDPQLGAQPAPLLNPYIDRQDIQKAWGIYLQDQITLTQKLQLRIGGRFDDTDLSSDDRLAGTQADQSSNRFSPQVGLLYALNPAISLYASYGEGFGPNLGAGVTGTQFDASVTQSAELGVKVDLLDAIVATASVFWGQQSNALTLDADNPDFAAALGDTQTKGFELDVNAALPGQMYAWLSYAYVDAKLDGAATLLGAQGSRLINLPRHTLNAQLSKDIYFGDRTLTLGSGVLYTSKRRGDTQSDFTLPGYATVRAFAQYDPVQGFKLRLDVDNIFDADYYTDAFTQLWVQPGQPRSFTISAIFSF